MVEAVLRTSGQWTTTSGADGRQWTMTSGPTTLRKTPSGSRSQHHLRCIGSGDPMKRTSDPATGEGDKDGGGAAPTVEIR